jgi:hypothetical protein
MEKIHCSTSIDHETKQISCLGLQDKPLIINYLGDVDLTELVSTLSSLIDQKKQIEFIIDCSIEDDKLKLIVDTLKNVFVSFNSKITIETETIVTDPDW